MNQQLFKKFIEEFLMEKKLPGNKAVDKNGKKNLWVDFQNLYGDIPYESTKTGIGPGEERLAKILGGAVQGPNSSFDLGILDPGGKTIVERWEVKEPDASGQIRPGTEGLKFANKVSTMISNVVSEMREFIDDMSTGEKMPIDSLGSSLALYEEVKNFLDTVPTKLSPKSNEELLTSGEITKVSFDELLRQVTNVQRIVKNLQSEVLEFDVDGKTFKVSPVKMLKISRLLGLTDDETKEKLGDVTEVALALSSLSNPAFENPSILLEKWNEMRASNVFGNSDGVILVDREGFTFIPASILDSKLSFVRISQGRPRFSTKASTAK